MIITCVAISHTGKGAYHWTQLVIDIQTCLKREQAFGPRVARIGKGLHMIIAEVAAETESWRELEILSYAVEQGSREFLVDAHEMRSYTYYIICAAIAEPQCYISLRGRAKIGKHIDARLGIDIDETYLMGNGVACVID